ncbi:MAG TPA: DUF6691 family protein [Methylophilus sp.]
MKNTLFALVAGLVFGLGLILAGMANPAKVLAFLDVSGLWDPSLIFVMLGGIALSALAYSYARSRQTSLLNMPLLIPTSRHIDFRLITGSLTFGVGWGIAGICPGPALVLLGAGSVQGLLFVAAMLAGMLLFKLLETKP